MPKGGRTDLDRGSLSAGYSVWLFTVPGATTVSYPITAPYACRVMEVMAKTTAGTSPTYSVVNTTDTANIVASRAIPTTVEILTPTSVTALANRDIDKGDIITIATGGTLGSNTVIAVTVKVESHVVADASND